jgi:hypothetical protein
MTVARNYYRGLLQVVPQNFKPGTNAEKSFINKSNHTTFMKVTDSITPLLAKVYPEETVEWLTVEIYSLIKDALCASGRENLRKWNHDNVLLITYGDSICHHGQHPLTVLAEFLSSDDDWSVTTEEAAFVAASVKWLPDGSTVTVRSSMVGGGPKKKPVSESIEN